MSSINSSVDKPRSTVEYKYIATIGAEFSRAVPPWHSVTILIA